MRSKRAVAVLLAGVSGLLIGWWLVGPLLGLLKPAQVQFMVIEPGEGFIMQLRFSVLFGILLGLPPLLSAFFRRSDTGQPWRILFLYAAGLAGGLLASLYFKMKFIEMVMIHQQVMGQEEPLVRLPQLFMIPLAGTITLMIVFLILRQISRPVAADGK